MIGYVCKYTPVEIIENFGTKTCRIEPDIADSGRSSSLMHPNMCAYAKAVLEECLKKNVGGLVLVNCCDSIKRLYDVLKNVRKFNFLYMLDLPRKNNRASAALFARQLRSFTEFCEEFFGKKLNPDLLIEQIKKRRENHTDKQEGLNIVIAGARCSHFITELIENTGANIVCNLTCTGNNSTYREYKGQEIMRWYADYLLGSYPCMRMVDIKERYNALDKVMENISGIIYHTVKFCDFYSFEYATIKEKISAPVLKIETDYTRQCKGQIKTRIEAFIESLKKGVSKPESRKMSKYVAGIDSGSTSTNVVIMDSNKNIISYSIVKTGAKSLDSACRAFEEALKKAGLKKEEISYIVSTGYGRSNVPFSHKSITEITCHAKGAYYLDKNVRTIIDIGGQDSKVIRLDDNGEVIDFAMNDKCAAGTGRFLEMMAKTLEVPIEEMGVESLKSKEKINITSMCTVFAESEVISLIAENKNKADIINGLHTSIARRTVSLLDRIGKKAGYMMTGGVAKNIGVVKALEEKIGDKIHIPQEPQIIGALGAALFALECAEESS